MSLRYFLQLGIAYTIVFAILSFPVFAHDHKTVVGVSAGKDQTVMVGDKVRLKGSLIYHKKHEKEEDDDDDERHHQRNDDDRDGDKDSHSNSFHKEKSEHHNSSKRHHQKIRLAWIQESGTPVELRRSHKLKTKFTAPTPLFSGEVLVFILIASDAHGHEIARDSVNVTVKSPFSTVLGRITNPDGIEIPNITVDVSVAGSSLMSASATSLTGNSLFSATSDARGNFKLELMPDTQYILSLSGENYADQVVPFKSPSLDGKRSLDVTMLQRGAVQTFDANSDVTLEGSDGTSVSISAGSFVDSAGTPVNGNIEVTMTPVDVSRSTTLAAFPGEFSGIAENATTTTPIVSFGAVEYSFKQNGQPVDLAPGKTADVLIPLYIQTNQDGSQIPLGASFPLWSLNKTTGIWQQQGNGTIVGTFNSPTALAMQATVSSFGWWNCDVSMNAAQAIVTVIGQPGQVGTATIHAHTGARIGWRPSEVQTVAALDTPTPPLYIPSNGEVCFWADIIYNDDSYGYTENSCVTAAPSTQVIVNLTSPPSGDLHLITIPANTNGVLDVTAYKNIAIDRIQLIPTTQESSVIYTFPNANGTGAGEPPTGLSFNVIGTRAEITGTPTVATPLGEPISVAIEGKDSEDFVDSVTINFTVIDDIPPPNLPEYIYISPESLPSSTDFELNFNSGGKATRWWLTLDPDLNWDGQPPPPPDWAHFDGDNLIVDCPANANSFWLGLVHAENGKGEVSTQIDIICLFRPPA